MQPVNFYDGERVVICIDCGTRRLSTQRECVECLQRAEDAALGIKRELNALALEGEPTNTEEVLIHIDLALNSLCQALVVTTDTNYAPILNLISDLKRLQASMRKEG